jgi:hypothetical protein
MQSSEAEDHQHCTSIRSVMPLPIALYVSDGLIFELYDGGQPDRQFWIRWERLKPIERLPRVIG